MKIAFYAARLGVFVFLITLSFGAPLFMKHLTKGFHIARLNIYHANSQKTPQVSEELFDPDTKEFVLAILSQPFTYLHRGAQCYVFESQDKQYVIKFFQKHRFAPCFFEWKKEKRKNKNIDFTPCLIAYTIAKEETGLIYMHLSPDFPKNFLLPKLSIRSPLGTWFSLSLDRYAFVIQKKAKSFKETLIQASREKKLEPYLSSFIALLESRIAKGIRNQDLSLSSNFGFLGQQAIEFDFGRYVQSEDFYQLDYQYLEKNLFISQLYSFMQENLPCDLEVLEKCLNPK